MGEAKQRRDGLIDGPSAPTPTTTHQGDHARLEETLVAMHLDAGQPIPPFLQRAAQRLGRDARKLKKCP